MDCPTCCKRIGGEGSTWQRWGVLAECCGQPWCWTCRARLFRSGMYGDKVQPQCPACGKAMGEGLSMYLMNICNSTWGCDWPAEKQADTDSKIREYMARLGNGDINDDEQFTAEEAAAAAELWMECVNCERPLKDERAYIVFEVEKGERGLVPGHGHPLCSACFNTSKIAENGQQVEFETQKISHQLLRRRARMPFKDAAAADDSGLNYFKVRTVSPGVKFNCRKCYPAGAPPAESASSFDRVQIVSFVFSSTNAASDRKGSAGVPTADHVRRRNSGGDDNYFSGCISPLFSIVQNVCRALVVMTPSSLSTAESASLMTPLLDIV